MAGLSVVAVSVGVMDITGATRDSASCRAAIAAGTAAIADLLALLWQVQGAELGGQGISLISYSQNQDEAMKFLEWLVKDDTQKKWAELGGYTAAAAILKSDEFQNATPYNKAFYETMFKVRDFWALPEYAALLDQSQLGFYDYVVNGNGTAQEALDKLAATWVDTLKGAGYAAE